MYKYGYFIPTHRPLSDNIIGFCKEIELAQQNIDYKIPLSVIDDMASSDNYNILKQYVKDFKNVEVFYFSKQNVSDILKMIKDEINVLTDNNGDILNSVFPSDKVNYGNAYNRIFLIGVLMGNEVIIRRDSDVYIQSTDNNSLISPLQLELENLSIEQKKYIFGGGYSGKYGIDIDDLIKGNNDFTLVKALFSCFSIPSEEHDDIIDLEILGNEKYVSDEILFNSSAYPDCGNCAYCKIFEFLPCSPVDYTIGTDYFLVEIAIRLGLTVGYHNRSVLHSYSKDRKDSLKKKYDYWKGIALLSDLKVIYKTFYKMLADKKIPINDIADLSNIVYNNMIDFADVIPSLINKREEKILDLIKILEESNNDDLISIAPELKKNIPGLIQQNEKGYFEHIELIKNWPKIIDAAKNIHHKININDYKLQ